MRFTASSLFRLLAAIAVVFMPFGTASAGVPATAAESAAEPGLCEGHGEPAGAPGDADRHCAACIALPALGAPAALAGLLPPGPVSIAAAAALLSPAPEVATPPPRTA